MNPVSASQKCTTDQKKIKDKQMGQVLSMVKELSAKIRELQEDVERLKDRLRFLELVDEVKAEKPSILIPSAKPSTTKPTTVQMFKKQPCNTFRVGKCTYGADCKFAHLPEGQLCLPYLTKTGCQKKFCKRIHSPDREGILKSIQSKLQKSAPNTKNLDIEVLLCNEKVTCTIPSGLAENLFKEQQ